MASTPLPSLAEPSTAAWNALCASVDAQTETPLDEAKAALRAWPKAVLRPMPYRWIFRAASRKGFPPAKLANALCLSDRWATSSTIDLMAFESLSEDQARRLAARSFPRLRVLDVSLQSADNPYSPGTMLNEVLDDWPKYLFGKAFSRVRALDISGISPGLKGIEALLDRLPLRTLVARECELDDDGIERLLRHPRLEKLAHLDLRSNHLHKRALRAILESPNLKGLRSLQGVGPDDLFDDIDEDEFEALLAASKLHEKAKTSLKRWRQDPPIFGAQTFPGVPGEKHTKKRKD